MDALTRRLAAWLLVPSAAAARDATALEHEVTELFRQWRVPLLRYLLSFGFSVSDAEEIAQDTFVALFQHLLSDKPRHALRAWIFRVAHNLALKRRRREHQFQWHPLGDLDGGYPDPAPNPEEQALFLTRQRRLAAVMESLPERDVWCLSLRAEGLRYREIAEALGMSLGAVAQSLARSLARLQIANER